MEIVPLTSREVPAAKAFNERLRETAAAFFLSETPDETVGKRIRHTQLVAWDKGAVRGGALEVVYPALLGGQEIEVTNYQSLISEGVSDKRYSLVGPFLIREIQRRSRYGFVVGMGGTANPLPRLLKASGWSVRLVPFLFRVHGIRRFLREMPVFRAPPWRAVAASLASSTGAGGLAVGLLQARGRLARPRARRCSIELVTEWGSWADALWERFAPLCAFAVMRTQRNLTELYPSSDPRLLRCIIRKDGQPVGWTVCVVSDMRDNRHFGNLRVGSILDVVALPDAMESAISLTDHFLAARGVDLVLSNQAHHAALRAFRACGFLTAGSNYVFAASRPLTDAIAAQTPAEQRVHITRGDGDGRIHL